MLVDGVVIVVCRSRASLSLFVCVCVPAELDSVSWRSACTVAMLHACPVPPIDSWCSHAVCCHVTAREAERVFVTRLCFCTL